MTRGSRGALGSRGGTGASCEGHSCYKGCYNYNTTSSARRRKQLACSTGEGQHAWRGRRQGAQVPGRVRTRAAVKVHRGGVGGNGEARLAQTSAIQCHARAASTQRLALHDIVHRHSRYPGRRKNVPLGWRRCKRPPASIPPSRSRRAADGLVPWASAGRSAPLP